MSDHPPKNQAQQNGHVSICWPERMLFDEAQRCVGFTMPKLDRATNREMLQFYNPKDRRQSAPGFTWDYLLRAAINVSIVVDSIHARGYVIGNVNESNFFISDQALVTLVDCDSMQVKTQNRVFHCTVAKPEYLAQELHGVDLGLKDRTAEQDDSSLALLMFLMLMDGVHPFSGVWKGAGDLPAIEERLWNGECPYADAKQMLPMPAAPPLDLLPAEIKSLFKRAFGTGHAKPSARPSPREWEQVLSAVKIKQCKSSKQHCYSSHLRVCPWCARTQFLNGFDPFPDPATLHQQAPAAVPQQQALPARPSKAKLGNRGPFR